MDQDALAAVKPLVQLRTLQNPSAFESVVRNADIEDRKVQPVHSQGAHVTLQSLDGQHLKFMVFNQSYDRGGAPVPNELQVLREIAVPVACSVLLTGAQGQTEGCPLLAPTVPLQSEVVNSDYF